MSKIEKVEKKLEESDAPGLRNPDKTREQIAEIKDALKDGRTTDALQIGHDLIDREEL